MPSANLLPLPIDALLPDVRRSLREKAQLVLVAPPGAGKTTRVPPALLEDLPGSQQIWVLQPRRIAARATAARIAEERGWRLGEEVGYQIRFEKRYGPRTRIKVLTEGILEKILVERPEIAEVGLVILDEFHERNLHSDLCLALLRESQRALRPDLKILVMSATLEAEPVSSFLENCPILRSEGRLFPVTKHYLKHPFPLLKAGAELALRVKQEVEALLEDPQDDSGHILVFLPGVGEIHRCRDELREVKGLEILPLHGTLSSAEQDRVLKPSPRRKLILATNIAETSLTIDGVTAVVDSGLQRLLLRNPQSGLDRLELTRISQHSAEQRAGRAGRQAAGRCRRLWTEAEQARLEVSQLPEIARVDLGPALLTLASWGMRDPHLFEWFERPPEEALENSWEELKALGAIDEEGRLTPLGGRLQELPLSPRLGRLLFAANDLGVPDLGLKLAAILGEKDFLRRPDEIASGEDEESDLLLRARVLEDFSRGRLEGHPGLEVGSLRQVERSVEALSQRFTPRPVTPPADPQAAARRALFLSFPDRLCRRRAEKEASARMVGGTGVLLDRDSIVREAEYFLALELLEGRNYRDRSKVVHCRQASRVEEEWIEELFPSEITVQSELNFDPRSGRILALKQRHFRDLPLGTPHPFAPTPEEFRDCLKELARKNPAAFFKADEELERLRRRLNFLEAHGQKLSPLVLADLIDQALPERSLEKLGLAHVYLNALAFPDKKRFDELAPDKITVPSGSSLRLDYGEDPTQAPVLAVRLQEIFGWRESPRLLQVPIALHLLGPNFRPVQVTSDLKNFWEKTYFEVRKELKARYPKHSWPDNPLEARPEAKGRRRS